MESNCLNCDTLITENFCSNCGQKKYKRIDRKYLMDEFQYLIVHTNKGFFYSVKNILKNPGKTARDFIEGNRVNHYKPILLAFVLGGISAFISFKLSGFNEILTEYYAQQNLPSALSGKVMSFLSSYNSLIMLLLIPFISILTKLAFRTWGQNYYEHVIMNAYIQSCYTIISIIIIHPILYLLRHNLNAFVLVTSLSLTVIPLIMVWFYKGFYKEKSLQSIIMRVSLIILMGIAVYVMLIMAMAILFIIFSGPETFKALQHK